MSFRVEPDPSLKDAPKAADHSLAGIWVCSASPLIAEICAGAGFDWVFIDAEHSPNDLQNILAQLQAVRSYPVVPVVRPAVNDPVIIKQFLDLGVQSLIIPMVNDAQQAAAAVAACQYPPKGVRGVGSALARSARWNRIPEYLTRADETITLMVQIEAAEAVENVQEILDTDGLDGIFIGPSDLAASMGVIGQQNHPEVVDAVLTSIKAAKAAGKYAGVNAFDQDTARKYMDAGADFVGVGADVALLARATEALAASFSNASQAPAPKSY